MALKRQFVTVADAAKLSGLTEQHVRVLLSRHQISGKRVTVIDLASLGARMLLTLAGKADEVIIDEPDDTEKR